MPGWTSKARPSQTKPDVEMLGHARLDKTSHTWPSRARYGDTGHDQATYSMKKLNPACDQNVMH